LSFLGGEAMTESQSPDQLRVERLAALCRDIEREVKNAANTRAKAADAFELLKYAQDQSTQLCPEVDKFLSMAPRLKRRSEIRTRQGRRARKKEA
jgi:hypothetical protein